MTDHAGSASDSAAVIGRRAFLALLAVPVVAAALQACAGDQSGTPTTDVSPDAPGDQVLRSGAARTVAAEGEAAAAVAALNAFGADLYGSLVAAAPTDNLVFSPASIALALAMVRGGASGVTADEIDDVLHVADPAAIHRSMNALSAALASRSGTFEVDGEPREVELSIANSLWSQAGLTITPGFLDLLAVEYGAALNTVDFGADPEGARSRINAWVADETRDRITELLAAGSITEETLLTLVNAVYLRAAWAEQFDEALTADAPFTRLDGSSVDVPTMRNGGFWQGAAGDGWVAVDLPYVSGSLSMLVCVPDDLAAFEATLSTGALDEVVASLDSRQVAVTLPRWTTTSTAGLGDVLPALGMPTAFSGDADFSGITTEAALSISAVVHQATITVDENGTEAAAATAIVMAGSAAPTDLLEVFANRPFLYALRDVGTGAVVFLGRVTDPTDA